MRLVLECVLAFVGGMLTAAGSGVLGVLFAACMLHGLRRGPGQAWAFLRWCWHQSRRRP